MANESFGGMPLLRRLRISRPCCLLSFRDLLLMGFSLYCCYSFARDYGDARCSSRWVGEVFAYSDVMIECRECRVFVGRSVLALAIRGL